MMDFEKIESKKETKRGLGKILAGLRAFLTSRTFLCSCLTQVSSVGWFVVGISLDQSNTSDYISSSCFLGFIVYFILALIFVPVLIYKGILVDTIEKHWWKYIIISIFEFEGTFCIVLAYKWASYTVLQFLDYSSNVWVLILSCIVLRKRFKIFHYIGTVSAVAGVVLLVIYDPEKDESEPSVKKVFIGEFVCLLGCFLYTCSDVISERYLQETTWYQWLGLFSLFLCPVTLVQGFILEAIWPSNYVFEKNNMVWIAFYVVAQIGYYIAMPICLSNIGAASVHLWLMTCEIYAVIYASQIKGKITYILAISIVLTFAGNIMFSLQSIYQEKEEKRAQHMANVAETLSTFEA